MRLYSREHYLDTREGLLAQHRQRSRRRIHFSIDDIEPRAKHSMPEADKDEVQRQLLEWLAERIELAMVSQRVSKEAFDRLGRGNCHHGSECASMFDLRRGWPLL